MWVELETEPNLTSPKADTFTHKTMPAEQQVSFNMCKNGVMLTILQAVVALNKISLGNQ